MAAAAVGCGGVMRGSSFLLAQRATGGGLWALLSATGVADSGPNSGGSGALGHSGTGVVGGVGGVEKVLVVVVVRSRYQ